MKQYRHRRGDASRSSQQQRGPANRVHESTSAKGKIRGTAEQLVERYLQFAEEARLSNDRVASEAFLQSAEHYVRLGNPVQLTSTRTVEDQPHGPAPANVKTFPDADAARVPDPVAIADMSQVSAPAAVIPIPSPSFVDAKIQKRARIAKRAAAADDLERIAGQHGYTLAQLGLILRS
ncbi:DUF4167 domain-containing protein [Paracoccus haeundaensis]|jgi:hypothetical protein|uniref:DUF4167 domain-containing protein n=1 Tax=Paracoccus haeundaensis TaxID=225362 RepID=A0A5C4R187_9RHOB|nr:DUF4167 domain-containing protein [Paracoccus haeundaensis]